MTVEFSFEQLVALGKFQSAGLSEGGVITNGGGPNVDVSAGDCLLRATASPTDPVAPYVFASLLGTAIPLDTTRYVGVEFNAGSPQIIIKSVNIWDNFTEFQLGVVINEANTIHVINLPHRMNDNNGLTLQRFFESAPVIRDNISAGLILSETADNNQNVTMTAGAVWVRLTRTSLSGIDTSVADTFDRFFSDGGSGFNVQAAQTRWSELNFDDGTGTIGVIPASEFANQWFYIDSDNNMLSIFGIATYLTLAEAVLESAPSNVPSRVSQRSLLLGRLIVQQGVTIAALDESAFSVVFSLSGVSDHNSLANLATGDPHTQYLDETRHDVLAADNPHSVTVSQALTADGGTDATAAELEELTDGSITTLHNHGVDLQIAQTATVVNTASSSFVDLPSMTLTTPNDGVTRNYKIFFSGGFNGNSNNNEGALIVDVGGVNAALSFRPFLLRSAEDTDGSTQHVAFSVAPNTIIKIEWQQVGGGNIDAMERSLIIEGVAV